MVTVIVMVVVVVVVVMAVVLFLLIVPQIPAQDGKKTHPCHVREEHGAQATFAQISTPILLLALTPRPLSFF